MEEGLTDIPLTELKERPINAMTRIKHRDPHFRARPSGLDFLKDALELGGGSRR